MTTDFMAQSFVYVVESSSDEHDDMAKKQTSVAHAVINRQSLLIEEISLF